jgi:type II secretion system protein C
MIRYASWLANGVLLVLCCFLVAQTANTVFAALLAPPPPEVAGLAAAPLASARPWSDREVILERNLFDSALLAPPGPEVVVEEELEATQLPLDLLGTVASPNARLSWAAVQDRETQTHLVLRVDDAVKGDRAKVVRIEPKRIVLSENGVLRELALSDEALAGGSSAVAPTSAAQRRASARERAQRRSAGRTRLPTPTTGSRSSGSQLAGRARIFSQAQVIPKYEDGRMVGMQVNSIQPESFWQQSGFENGDIITEVNGVAVDSPTASAKLLSEFTQSDSLSVTVQGSDGTETLTVSIPEEEE